MTRKTGIFLLRGVLFCLVLVATLIPVTRVFARKSLSLPWDMTTKIAGFYNEPADEFEVMFFGSSHAYASFSPLTLWQDTGVKSYVFATQQQPLWATWTYLQEALKSQSPSLVVVECNMAANAEEYMDDGVNFSYMDDLKLSREKLLLAQASAPADDRLPLVWNFMKYHTRWQELKTVDFTTDRSALRDPYRGFVLLPDRAYDPPYEDVSAVTDSAPLTEKNEAYLQRIIALCREKGIALWLCKAPSNPTADDQRAMNRVAEIAAQNGVPFDDFNLRYEEIGIVPVRDFYDDHHLDGAAAARFTDYFAGLLTARYTDLAADPDDAQWRAAYEAYADKIAAQADGTGGI